MSENMEKLKRMDERFKAYVNERANSGAPYALLFMLTFTAWEAFGFVLLEIDANLLRIIFHAVGGFISCYLVLFMVVPKHGESKK